MNVWNGKSIAAVAHDPILVLGPEGPLRDALLREVTSLPAKAFGAADFEEAASIVFENDQPPSILLVPEVAIDSATFEADLSELRIRSGSPRLVPIAYGRAPDDERRREIREAGVDLALFGRFGRHALRFQINRALSPWAERSPRGELRAPKEWRARTFASGREKSVRCYSLSSAGAYLVTPRPWVVGSAIDLELPVGHDRLRLPGRIVYTHAGDSADRRGLPTGMAVTFDSLSEHVQAVIRQDVTATHEALRV